MKQGILLSSVSLGQKAGGLEQLKEKICVKFSSIRLYHGVTGKRFQESEIAIDSVLRKMEQDGIQTAYFIPIYLLDGIEYEALLQKIEASKIEFCKATPFLCKTENIKQLALVMKQQCVPKQDKIWVYVGHGTKHDAEKRYQMLEQELQNRADILIATLDGQRGLQAVLDKLEKERIKTVELLPLMLCGGVHLQRDIMGEKGWAQRLREKGYQVNIHQEELTALPLIQQQYQTILENMIEKEKSDCID